MSQKLIKKQGGFTLLELLIVIVIIGILALIIVPGLASGPQRARDAQRKSDLRSIKNAMETYFNDNNAYPSASTTAVVPKTDATISAALSPSYLKTIPDDPSNGKHYSYVCTTVTSGTCTSFKLYASLENSKDSQINDTADATNGYEVTSVN